MHELQDVDCDFIRPAGRSMGKFNPNEGKVSLLILMKYVVKFVFNRYDIVILPSALLSRVGECNKGIKAKVGRFLYRLSYNNTLCKVIRKCQSILFWDTEVAFVERYSQMTVQRNLFAFFSNATLFKTIGRNSYPHFPRLHVEVLPYWINTECYPQLDYGEFIKREYDVFYTGTSNCKARGIADELYEKSIDSGVNFLWQKEKVSLDRFVELLTLSRIAWSPEGTNWHCWRHYESLFYGSIPLINRPSKDIYQDLVHGETCLFYDSVDQAVELIKDLISGRLVMKTTSDERRQFVLEKHSAKAAGECIINFYKSSKK